MKAVSLWLLGALAGNLAAQVGHEPAKSPYRDLDLRHEITVLSGVFKPRNDPANVGPQSGRLVGVRYQWLAGGPANLTAEITRVGSERRVIDPELPGKCPTASPDCKLLDVYRWPLYFVDAGFALNFTGGKSYRGLVPEARGTIGIVSDFHTKADIGDFQFGTKLSASWGLGIRWLARGPWQVRCDLTNRVYSIGYPQSYYDQAPDSTTVFGDSTAVLARRSRTMSTPTITIGVSFLFGR